MRINHKSDFDFRLDLYAADPYGTAVASGFPDCDFSGKLFIGPSVRSRQCYTFSKRDNTLVNCFDCDGHLHIVVSGHNLNAGPLFCELSLKVEDDRYPGGFRSVVHTFPLNIYLTETDAEQISPTVSITLPMIQKAIAMPPVIDDPTEEVTPTIRATSRLTEPWLSPKVCGGHFRTGAYVGNVYRNDKGRIFLSGHKSTFDDYIMFVHIPTLMKLGIKELTIDNLISKIKTAGEQGVDYTAEIKGDQLLLVCKQNSFPGYYLEIPKSPFAVITPEGKIKYYQFCPIAGYKPNNVQFDELHKHIELQGRGVTAKIHLDFGSSFILQKWGRQKRISIFKQGMQRFTVWVHPHIPIKKWNTKNKVFERISVRPLFFRVARKKHGAISDWLYFKALCLKNYHVKLIQTDETGAAMTANSIII